MAYIYAIRTYRTQCFLCTDGIYICQSFFRVVAQKHNNNKNIHQNKIKISNILAEIVIQTSVHRGDFGIRAPY